VKRRTLIRVGGLGVAGVATTGAAFGVEPFGSDDSRPEYLGREPVVYERDDLRLEMLRGIVRRGETVTFELTNTGESWITLGCGNPWALQKRAAGGWRHVAWTGERYYQLCLSGIEPGETVTEHVPMSKSELDSEFGPIAADLSTGEYRFVLIGTEPYPAVDFCLR